MSYSFKSSLKDIIDIVRKGSISVIVYDSKTNVNLIKPVNYDELLEHLLETKQLCFYDDKGNIIITEAGFFSVNNYNQSKLEKMVEKSAKLPQKRKDNSN